MTSHYLEMFMATNRGSKVSFHFHKGSVLDYLNLQTGLMCKMFRKFPEVLLMIRSLDAQGKALYTFLADGPCPPTSGNTEKIVHLAVPRDESHQGLARMFQAMRDFNANWRDVRVFLVEPEFKGAAAILEVFPSAEVVLSAFHICRHFQQSIYKQSLPSQTEHLLIEALKNTMCSATKENLSNMHTILSQCLKPGMLAQLKADWLLADRTWALHRWRSSGQCFEYFQTLETLSRAFTEIFKNTREANSIPRSLVKYIQDHALHVDAMEKRTYTSHEAAIIDGQGGEDGGAVGEPSEDPEDAALACQSLEDICNPAAFSLCRKELEVAQKSVHVMGMNEETVNVQLLENQSEVSYGMPATCSCNFHQTLNLPCRHILAVVTASESVMRPNTVHGAWRRQPDGAETEPPVSPDLLEILKGESADVPEKAAMVESLTGQLSQLLSDCGEDTFQQRYNTLRELADAWIGPYEQVKL
ncbi:zinc finger SWIM domain-containing protein 1 [Mantella aurantiaca]